MQPTQIYSQHHITLICTSNTNLSYHFPTPTSSLYSPLSSMPSLPHPTCCYCSLQYGGTSPLAEAACYGHIEVVKALLQAPGINVNQANVSVFLLTLSHVVVGRKNKGHLPSLPPHPPLSVMMSYYPLNLENIQFH